MTGEFYLGEGSLQRFAQSHQEVADGITQLAGGALDATGVANSHGPIASRVAGALSGALGSRQDTLGVTGTASNGFVDRLNGAAKSYGVHDEQGADDIRSAAEGMDGQQGTAGSGGASSASGASSQSQSGGAEMIGQIGQQVGQAVGQAISGITQAASQIPQQIMQGVLGVMQAVTGAGGAAGGAVGAGTTGANLASSATETVEKASEKDDDDKDRKPEHAAREDKSREHAAPGAQPGSTIHGPVPDAHAPAPKQPAQTRPQ
jgi:hypothetical protein